MAEEKAPRGFFFHIASRVTRSDCRKVFVVSKKSARVKAVMASYATLLVPANQVVEIVIKTRAGFELQLSSTLC